MSKNIHNKSSIVSKTRSKSIANSSNINNRDNGRSSRDLIAKAYTNQIVEKNADGEYAPIGYTKRVVKQADKAELISVARAMNGDDDFESKMRQLFNGEVQAASRAIATGLYIGYRCPEFTWDCIRVNEQHKCFCGHLLGEHERFDGKKYMLPCGSCKCKRFAFVPARPEDVGEFWFARRRNFDPTQYKVKCKCKHAHDQHDPVMHNCTARGCACSAFNSDFLCAACDKHWEEHETFFETEKERREKGLPYGEQYKPFNEMQELKNVLYTNDGHALPLDYTGQQRAKSNQIAYLKK